jgi:hypothetical protein
VAVRMPWSRWRPTTSTISATAGCAPWVS